MLRASIEYSGSQAELGGIASGAKAGDAGIEHGERLSAFADAAVLGDAEELTMARDALREVAGFEVVVDAAGVIGNFQRMVRIADGTGIPLDGVVGMMSEDIRRDLGLEVFRSRRLLDTGLAAKWFGPIVRGAARAGLRIAGNRTRK
jgi:hypothetical protein